MAGDAGEHIGEPRLRIDVVQLGGDDETVHRRSALPAAIGCKRVSFGKADDMQRLLGIAPGSVTPLAAINAAPGSITVVLDAGLAAAERVNVHPMRNTGTIGLAGATILDLLRHWGHEPLIASIPVQDNP